MVDARECQVFSCPRGACLLVTTRKEGGMTFFGLISLRRACLRGTTGVVWSSGGPAQTREVYSV